MNKAIIDANVMILAGTPVRSIPNDMLYCYEKCVDYIEQFMDDNNGVFLDAQGEILKEYENSFRNNEYPNMSTEFLKWALVHAEFVALNEIEPNVYIPYPDNAKLKGFDPSDRKYIALAYKHPQKPDIIEGTDSKWWGIKQELADNGITLVFIDEEYISKKYRKKMIN